MGSIIVNMFKPLVGTSDGGATTGRVRPEEDATTIADEVDASLDEEYAGGPGTRSESGAPYGPEELGALMTEVRNREPTYSASPFFSLRAPLASSSSKIIFRGINTEAGWLRVLVGEWGYNQTLANAQSRLVYRPSLQGPCNHTSRCAVTVTQFNSDSRWRECTGAVCSGRYERRLTMCKFN